MRGHLSGSPPLDKLCCFSVCCIFPIHCISQQLLCRGHKKTPSVFLFSPKLFFFLPLLWILYCISSSLIHPSFRSKSDTKGAKTNERCAAAVENVTMWETWTYLLDWETGATRLLLGYTWRTGARRRPGGQAASLGPDGVLGARLSACWPLQIYMKDVGETKMVHHKFTCCLFIYFNNCVGFHIYNDRIKNMDFFKPFRLRGLTI